MAARTFIFPNTSQKSLLYPWHPEPLHVPVVQHVPTRGELQMLQDPYGSVPAFTGTVTWRIIPVSKRFRVSNPQLEGEQPYLRDLFQGSLYYQPKQCTIKGKSLKMTIPWHCLIPPKMGNLMIPVLSMAMNHLLTGMIKAKHALRFGVWGMFLGSKYLQTPGVWKPSI